MTTYHATGKYVINCYLNYSIISHGGSITQQRSVVKLNTEKLPIFHDCDIGAEIITTVRLVIVVV